MPSTLFLVFKFHDQYEWDGSKKLILFMPIFILVFLRYGRKLAQKMKVNQQPLK